MAVQDQYWHDIAWEEKKYFNNTTSTNYGNPVQAFYRTGEDGKPYWRDLTEAGLEYFGVKKEDGSEEKAETSNSAENTKTEQRKAGFFTKVFVSVAAASMSSGSSKPITKHAASPKPVAGGAVDTVEKTKVPTPKREVEKRAKAKAEGTSSQSSASRRKVTLNTQSNPKLAKPVKTKASVMRPSAAGKKKVEVKKAEKAAKAAKAARVTAAKKSTPVHTSSSTKKSASTKKSSGMFSSSSTQKKAVAKKRR